MADDRVSQGYRVIKSQRIKTVEIVLAHNSAAPAPYVTWKAYAHTKFQDFAYGNYFPDLESAERDFFRRITEVRKEFGLPIPKPDRSGHDGPDRHGGR